MTGIETNMHNKVLLIHHKNDEEIMDSIIHYTQVHYTTTTISHSHPHNKDRKTSCMSSNFIAIKHRSKELNS